MLVKEESKPSVTRLELYKRVLFTPHGIALILMWLLTTVSLVVMLFGRVRNTGQFRVERDILQVAYVLALFWYLIRTGPSIEQLPDIRPLLLPRLQIGKLIPIIVIDIDKQSFIVPNSSINKWFTCFQKIIRCLKNMRALI